MRTRRSGNGEQKHRGKVISLEERKHKARPHLKGRLGKIGSKRPRLTVGMEQRADGWHVVVEVHDALFAEQFNMQDGPFTEAGARKRAEEIGGVLRQFFPLLYEG